MRMKLKLFRVAQDMTQAQMAERLGGDIATYAAIEKGTRSGRIQFWLKLQDTFPEIDIRDFMRE